MPPFLMWQATSLGRQGVQPEEVGATACATCRSCVTSAVCRDEVGSHNWLVRLEGGADGEGA